MSTRFGRRTNEKYLENAGFIFCSSFQNLRLGTIHFDVHFNGLWVEGHWRLLNRSLNRGLASLKIDCDVGTSHAGVYLGSNHRHLGTTHRTGSMHMEPSNQARRPETMLAWEFSQFVVTHPADITLPY